KKVAVAVAVLALVLLGLGIFANRLIAARAAEIAELTIDRNRYDDKLVKLQPDVKYIEAYKEWSRTAVPWLDELYDLAARFPKKPGLRVTKLEVNQVQPRNTKDKPLTRLTVTGLAYSKDVGQIYDLAKRINQESGKEKYCQASVDNEGKNTNTATQ